MNNKNSEKFRWFSTLKIGFETQIHSENINSTKSSTKRKNPFLLSHNLSMQRRQSVVRVLVKAPKHNERKK